MGTLSSGQLFLDGQFITRAIGQNSVRGDNEYATILEKLGDTLKKRTPGEQKTAIGYFLDRIEVLRDEGVARCYFYDTPRP